MSRMTYMLSAVVATALPFVAWAQVVEVQYRPVPGVSLNYGSMGYTPEGGEYTPLTDSKIVSARAHFEFTPAAGVDPATFIAAMVVPVLDAESEFWLVEGTSFVQSSPGVFSFDVPVTTEFNGTIRGGRFSVDCYALDAEENPIAIDGTLSDSSGFFFTVAIPEPASAAGVGLMMLLARRRR